MGNVRRLLEAVFVLPPVEGEEAESFLRSTQVVGSYRDGAKVWLGRGGRCHHPSHAGVRCHPDLHGRDTPET